MNIGNGEGDTFPFLDDSVSRSLTGLTVDSEEKVLAAAQAMAFITSLSVKVGPTDIDGLEGVLSYALLQYSNHWEILDYLEIGKLQPETAGHLFQAMAETESVIRGSVERHNMLNNLGLLQAKLAVREELTDFETEYRRNLIMALTTGSEGATRVHVQELLLKKVGPEKYARIARRFQDHQRELKILQDINEELNKQIEMTAPRPASADAPMQLAYRPFEPGCYLIEADGRGNITSSYKVTSAADLKLPGLTPEANALADRIRAGIVTPVEVTGQGKKLPDLSNRLPVEKPSFWTRVKDFWADIFFLDGGQ